MSALKKKALLAAALLGAALLFPAAAAAKMDLRAELNFDNTLHQNSWNLLTVTARNQTAADWQGTVEVRYGGGYSRPLFLEQGKAAELTFFLPPAELVYLFFQDYEGSVHVSVSLKDARGREVASQNIHPVPQEPEPCYIGILGGEQGHFRRLNGLLEGGRVVPFREEMLNHGPFMANFRLLIVSDGGAVTLKPEQQDNLAAWVEAGGLLVVGGGSRAAGNLALLPAELRPFTPAGTAVLQDIAASGSGFEFTGTAAEYLAATGTVRGDVLLAAGEYPLLCSLSRGRGRVVFSALDLEGPPFNSIAEFERFWSRLWTRFAGTSGELPFYKAHWGLNNLLNYLVTLGGNIFIFSVAHLGLGLLAYILLLGPVNFLLLRRFKRWEWAWFSIPLLAVAFTALIYILATQSRAAEPVNYQINILRVDRDRAAVCSFNSLFITRRGEVSYSITAPALAAGPGAIAEAAAPEAAEVRLPSPSLWSLHRYYTEGTARLAGPLQLEAAVGPGNEVQATVANHTELAFFDSYLRFGDNWYAVGELAPGETRTLDLTHPTHPDLNQVLRQRLGGRQYDPYFWLDEMLPQKGELLFVGLNDSFFFHPPAEIEGKTSLDFVLAGLPPAEFSLPRECDLPPGWLYPRIILPGGQGGGRAEYYHHGGEYVAFGTGQLDLVFSLPPLDYSRGTFTLDLSSFQHGARAELQAYNSAGREWESLATFTVPTGEKIVLDRIAELVEDDRLTLRITFDDHELVFNPGRLLSMKGGGGR